MTPIKGSQMKLGIQGSSSPVKLKNMSQKQREFELGSLIQSEMGQHSKQEQYLTFAMPST